MSENILQTQINQILEIVKSHDNRFNSIEERIDVLSEQIRQLDKQHGERLAKLEVITLGHDNRMDKLTNQIDDRIDKLVNQIDDKIDKLTGRMDKLTDKVDSMYKWILGLLLPMWASIIIAILLK
jgi:uncharacterized phage infection (PIP) family protein YhgE